MAFKDYVGNETSIKSTRALGKELSKRGFEPKATTDGQRGFKGIKLKAPADVIQVGISKRVPIPEEVKAAARRAIEKLKSQIREPGWKPKSNLVARIAQAYGWKKVE